MHRSSVSSMSTTIAVQQTIQANVQRIMQARIDACRLTLSSDPPHLAIHQARKEMKMIRALLRLVRQQIGEENYREANHHFRDAARLISDARDVTASWETASSLQSLLPSPRDRRAMEHVKRHLRAKKAAITRYQVNRGRLLQSVQEVLADAERFHRSWIITEDGFVALEKGIKRIYRQCLKRQRVAYEHDRVEEYHQWRKSVKYLRYQLDTLHPLRPGLLGGLENELNQLTDYLGNDHDLAVLREMITQTALLRPETRRTVFRVLEEQRQGLQQAAKPLAKKLFYQKPKRFIAPLAYWWEVEAQRTADALVIA